MFLLIDEGSMSTWIFFDPGEKGVIELIDGQLHESATLHGGGYYRTLGLELTGVARHFDVSPPWLNRLLEHRGLLDLRARYVPTPKNKPVETLFEDHGLHLAETRPNGEKLYALGRSQAKLENCDWIDVLTEEQKRYLTSWEEGT